MRFEEQRKEIKKHCLRLGLIRRSRLSSGSRTAEKEGRFCDRLEVGLIVEYNSWTKLYQQTAMCTNGPYDNAVATTSLRFWCFFCFVMSQLY